MGIVLLYTTFGGMWAVIQTDVVQFVILGVFIPVALVIGLVNVGGPAELAASVPETHFSLRGDWSLALFASTFIAILLGETLAPPYTQRAFSTPDPASARKGFALAGVLAFFFFFITATLGLVALVLFPGIQPDRAIPTVLRELLPAGITGLVLAALLAVVMSTSDSFLNSTAVVFVKDIYQPFINPNISESRILWLQRLVTAVVGVIAIVFALSATSIIGLFLNIYALWAPTIIIPLVLATMWGFRSRIAALSAIVGGGATTVVWTWALDEPFGITGLMAGVAINGAAFAIAYNVFDRGNRSTEVSSPERG